MKQANFAFLLALSSVLLGSALAQPQSPGAAPKTKPPGASKPVAAPAKPQPKENAAKEPEPELTPQQQRVLSLVREAAQEAGALADKRSAATIQARAADLLWPQDQPTAKELFAKAFDTGLNYYRDTNDDNRRKIIEGAYLNRTDVLLDVIRLVNKRDKELGRSYTEKYIEEKKRLRETQPDQTSDQDLNRLLGDNQAAATGLWRVADSLLEAETALSVEIATRALALAITQNAAMYFPRLAARDRKLADQLYLKALNRLRADPAPLPSQLLMLTAYPFGTGMVRIADGQTSYGYGFGAAKNFAVDPLVVRQLLSAAYAILSRVAEPATLQLPDSAGRYNAAFYAAKLLEPKVAEFQPALLEEWRALSLRLTTATTEKTRQSLETNAQRDATPSEKRPPSDPQAEIKNNLERAEQATDINKRDNYYAQAALAASQAGEAERALEIAGKTVDLTLRRDLKSWISQRAAERAQTEKRWDDARRYALDVEAPDARAYLLFQLATVLRKEGDTARAGSLLEEAYRQADAAANSPDKVKALLGIANAYILTDFVRGYEVADAAVKTANQLPRDQSGLDPDDNQLVTKLKIGGGSMVNTNSVEGFDLGRTVANLARHDFERALSLLRAVDDLALRYTATVTVAESLL
ncbi:MAG: hypothetical protein HYR56_13420 [Acidobacteria bacterium]|nr:hypothetical protein [Acidobacteriota bacterium]MBI3424673.1 hypothetical protein [Acidobacteriota bacterium]